MTTTGKSHAQTPRTAVLPVAEIYELRAVEAFGREAMFTVLLGDDRTPPRRHGLRAPLKRWAEAFAALAAAEPEFAALVARTAPPALDEPSPAGAPVPVVVLRAALPPVAEVPPCDDPGHVCYRRR